MDKIREFLTSQNIPVSLVIAVLTAVAGYLTANGAVTVTGAALAVINAVTTWIAHNEPQPGLQRGYKPGSFDPDQGVDDALRKEAENAEGQQ